MNRAAGFVAALLIVLVAVPLLSAQPDAIVVEDWSKQSDGKTGIPEGWKGQTWGSPKHDFIIETQSPNKILHMKSPGDSSNISREVKVDVKQYPFLQWRWKAVTLPKGADSRRKEADDQACQVYVTFLRFPSLVRSRLISYVWDSTAPAGTIVQSQKTGLVTYVILRSGPAELNQWLTETRNVHEDYKKIYGEEPGEPVGAISVGIDSDDTHSTAECFIGEIAFKKQP